MIFKILKSFLPIITWVILCPALQAAETNAVYSTNLQSTINAYMMGHRRLDPWFVTNIPPSSQSLGIVLGDKKDQILQIIQKSRNVSPLAGKLFEHFKDFTVSIFDAQTGNSRTVSDRPYVETNLIEICFIPAIAHRTVRFPGSLYWRSDWNAIMISALEFPPIVLAGDTMHELGHAYMATVEKAPSSTAPVTSDSYIGEEITMHTLEAQVFDELSAHKYFKCCDDILKAHESAGSVSELLSLVTADELKSLDASVGAENCGYRVVNTLLAEHLTVLGFRYIDGHSKDVKDKVAFYRLIAQP